MLDFFSHGYIALFIIIAFGMIIGRIKIFGFSFDISAVIFVALFLGHYGMVVPDDFMKLGLLLFIFTIGIQAGPGFFEAFQKYGRALIVTTLLALSSAVIVLIILTKTFHLDHNLAIGIFNGALTSTPGLAAAIESTNSPLATVGYGIAYTFGVIGVILSINILPIIFKVKIKNEEIDYQNNIKKDNPELFSQNLIIENPNLNNKKISELKIKKMADVVLAKVLHEGNVLPVKKDTILFTGDLIKVTGSKTAIDQAKIVIGKNSDKKFPPTKEIVTEWILITNKEIVNKKYSQLDLHKS